MEEKLSPSKVGVVVSARNEEKYIERTLRSITQQTLKPAQVIVVDDYSHDRTGEISSSFQNVSVVRFPYDHENYVTKKELANVVNTGLSKLSPDLDYVTAMGADEVLPKNHFEYITDKMRNTKDLVIASGIIAGEYSTIPRGSGRLVDWAWWKKINNGLYPVNLGFESWMIGVCVSENKKYAVFPEIISNVQRPTGSNYRPYFFFLRGQAYRALGYNRRFVLLRSILMSVKRKNPVGGIKLLLGYLDSTVDLYPENVRRYYRKRQDVETSIRNWRDLYERFKEA